MKLTKFIGMEKMKMKSMWRIIVIMVCMLCVTSCNKDNRKPQNNNKEKSELIVNTIGTDDEVENGSNVDVQKVKYQKQPYDILMVSNIKKSF